MGRILFEEGIYKKTFPVSTTAHLKARPRIHIRLIGQERSLQMAQATCRDAPGVKSETKMQPTAEVASHAW